MRAEDIAKRESELAARVMSLSMGKLLLRLHFFSAAAGRLRQRQIRGTMLTDGRTLGFDPAFVLKRYKSSELLPVHDLLHVLLHCVFRHWDVGRVRPPLWSAACDMVIEAVIADIYPELCPEKNASEREEILRRLSLEVKPLTAEKLYAYLDKARISDEQAEEYGRLFSADDHRTWYKPETEPEKEPESQLPHIFPELSEEGEKKEDDESSGGSSDRAQQGESGEEIPRAEDSDGDGSAVEQWIEEQKRSDKKELAREWEEIARQIQSELESFGKGEDTQRLIDVLERIDREKVDYRAFLRRFAVSGEVMKPDLDAFDNGFYCYGLELYGNVALIEPPEHKEVRRIKDFVIAVDTSGSVSGKVVHDFIQKTYNILKSEESFFSRVNIHILQCDTRIEDDALITCEEELERYIDELQIKGLGGTDFRPVFEYVDRLRAEGGLANLKGLIYFTDGIGSFPEKAPDYETAFLFLERDYERNDRPNVPPWAIKLVLEEGDVLDG